MGGWMIPHRFQHTPGGTPPRWAHGSCPARSQFWHIPRPFGHARGGFRVVFFFCSKSGTVKLPHFLSPLFIRHLFRTEHFHASNTFESITFFFHHSNYWNWQKLYLVMVWRPIDFTLIKFPCTQPGLMVGQGLSVGPLKFLRLGTWPRSKRNLLSNEQFFSTHVAKVYHSNFEIV